MAVSTWDRRILIPLISGHPQSFGRSSLERSETDVDRWMVEGDGRWWFRSKPKDLYRQLKYRPLGVQHQTKNGWSFKGMIHGFSKGFPILSWGQSLVKLDFLGIYVLKGDTF